MHQGTEQHRAFADSSELQLLKEAVLLGAVLEHGDVRGEGVFALEVNLFDRLKGQRRQIDIAPARHLVEQALEILRRRLAPALFLLRGQHQQVLRAREGRVEQPPEVEVLDVVEWLKALLREVAAILQQHIQFAVLLARHCL
ncbi:hypothetical protein D9M69_279280 [compost metagenome]